MMSQMEAVARQLQEENRRIKARTNEQDERLKRLATQVKKEEETVAAQSKKAGVRPEQIKDLALKDATAKKLLQNVREREKQNTALERHIAVYKHSFPQQQKSQHTRRPLWETANRSPQQSAGGTPASAKSGRRSKEGSLMLGTDEDDQQRLVFVLEGELERSSEQLTQLRAELAVATKQGKDDEKSASTSGESVDQLKRRLKEITARLTILLNTQERTQAAFKEEEDQHTTLVNEVDSLNSMLSELRQQAQQLSRDKQVAELQLRKGDGDDLGKLIADTRRELEELDRDNRSLRDMAFKTGSYKVAVRVTEDEQRVKKEENASLTEEQKRLQAQVDKLQQDVDEVEKSQIQGMRQTITNLDQQAQKLHKETEKLREQMHSLAGQQQHGPAILLAPPSSRGGFRTVTLCRLPASAIRPTRPASCRTRPSAPSPAPRRNTWGRSAPVAPTTPSTMTAYSARTSSSARASQATRRPMSRPVPARPFPA